MDGGYVSAWTILSNDCMYDSVLICSDRGSVPRGRSIGLEVRMDPALQKQGIMNYDSY